MGLFRGAMGGVRGRGRGGAQNVPAPAHALPAVPDLPGLNAPDDLGDVDDQSAASEHDDSLYAANEAAENAFQIEYAQLMRGVSVPVREHNDRLRADVVQKGYGQIVNRHLMQTDNNVQPVMGAVQL